MIQIRNNVFETNSSSTHSITIVPKEEFDKWERGELYFNDSYGRSDDEMWLTKEQVKEMAEKDEWFPSDEVDWEDTWSVNQMLKDTLEIYTADEYLNDGYGYYETYVKPYTTKSGDKIVAFGMYGHD